MGDDRGTGAADPPPFIRKTFELVSNAQNNAVISWGEKGESFIVWNTETFSRDELPRHFKHNNFSSFVRQLNTYGFHKNDPDRWEFQHKHFRRGAFHELAMITRRKSDQKAAPGRSMPVRHIPAAPLASRPAYSNHIRGPLYGPSDQAPRGGGPAGSKGLSNMGAAGTTLRAENGRCLQAPEHPGPYSQTANPSGMPGIGIVQPKSSHWPEAESHDRESGLLRQEVGNLREEVGRQGSMIRELVAEIGQMKERQDIMAMQLRRMDDQQQASKKQRTDSSPASPQCSPAASGEAASRGSLASDQRLSVCETGLSTMDANFMVLYHGMKNLEAHVKAETETIGSRVCSALSQFSRPGSTLEDALKKALAPSKSPPSQRAVSSSAAEGVPPLAKQASEGGHFCSAMYNHGRGPQPCRDESVGPSHATARVPQS